MENIDVTFWSVLAHILLALLGALGNILNKLRRLEKMSDFSFKIWWLKNRFSNIYTLFIAILTAIVIIGLNEPIWTCVTIGFAGDALVRVKSRKIPQ